MLSQNPPGPELRSVYEAICNLRQTGCSAPATYDSLLNLRPDGQRIFVAWDVRAISTLEIIFDIDQLNSGRTSFETVSQTMITKIELGGIGLRELAPTFPSVGR
jgi:hypothetical protein